ncbi:MAG: hypothetical protein R2789_06780 [Microthrixaceae bacterium]
MFPCSKASGGAATALAEGWDDEADGGLGTGAPGSPASSAWGQVLNQRLSDAGEALMAAADPTLMLTPLVIAMPQPMAEALGWPDTPIGAADICLAPILPEGPRPRVIPSGDRSAWARPTRTSPPRDSRH